MTQIPVALQLYTVRDETARDFAGTVRKVAEMGYAGVEFAGTGDLSAQQMVDLLGETGLKPAGAHIGLSLIQEDLAEISRLSHAIGNKYMGVPALPGELRNPAGFLQVAAMMNEVGGSPEMLAWCSTITTTLSSLRSWMASAAWTSSGPRPTPIWSSSRSTCYWVALCR